jgi:hypothetical protein
MRDAGNIEARRSLVTPVGVPCTMDANQLLVQMRRFAMEVRHGDESHVKDMVATFAELDERLSASGQLPNDWKGVA